MRGAPYDQLARAFRKPSTSHPPGRGGLPPCPLCCDAGRNRITATGASSGADGARGDADPSGFTFVP